MRARDGPQGRYLSSPDPPPSIVRASCNPKRTDRAKRKLAHPLVAPGPVPTHSFPPLSLPSPRGAVRCLSFRLRHLLPPHIQSRTPQKKKQSPKDSESPACLSTRRRSLVSARQNTALFVGRAAMGMTSRRWNGVIRPLEPRDRRKAIVMVCPPHTHPLRTVCAKPAPVGPYPLRCCVVAETATGAFGRLA